MYFLIAIWGHERRVYAAIKFFLFTQLSSLLMLIAILALYFFHHAATGIYTFEYSRSDRHPSLASRGDVANARLFCRFCGQAADVPAAYVASRRAHRGSDRGKYHPCRLAA